MSGSAVALTQIHAKRLDMARRRRRDGHTAVEDDWVRIIAELKNAGVSVKAIADHLGVSRQTVYDWLEKAGRLH